MIQEVATLAPSKPRPRPAPAPAPAKPKPRTRLKRDRLLSKVPAGIELRPAVADPEAFDEELIRTCGRLAEAYAAFDPVHPGEFLAALMRQAADVLRSRPWEGNPAERRLLRAQDDLRYLIEDRKYLLLVTEDRMFSDEERGKILDTLLRVARRWLAQRRAAKGS